MSGMRVNQENPNLRCGECSSVMVLRLAGKKSNPPRPFYGCSRYPRCQGTHPALVDGSLRPPTQRPSSLRTKAHDAFTALVKRLGRGEPAKLAEARAYAWLGQQLGIPEELCRFREFDRAQCERAIELIGERMLVIA